MRIDAHLVATLRPWRLQLAQRRLAWGEAYEDADDLVFGWEGGRPVLPDCLTKQIGKEQAGLGLPRLTLHELPHADATILLRDRVPGHIVSKRLRHKHPSETLNTYADVIPDDDTSAADVFTQAVGAHEQRRRRGEPEWPLSPSVAGECHASHWQEVSGTIEVTLIMLERR